MSLKNLIQSKSAVLCLIALLLLLVPFFLWGNTYLVGGDDTKLYYVFPREFLSNYVFNIVSDNTLGGAMTGYASVSYFAPVFFTFLLFKLIPFVSTQMLLYGLNLALGFLGFYKMSGLWIEDKSSKTFYARILGSLFYVSSIYLVHTLYVNQLLAIYLASVIPFTIYYFIKGVRLGNARFILLSILIFSLFSSTINTVPWSAAVLVAFLPIFLYEAFLTKKKFFKYAFLFLSLSFLLNFYWIFHIIYPYFHPSGLPSMLEYYSSHDFIKDNIRIITGVSQLYSPLNIPFNQMDTNFFENISWVTILQSVFFIVIVLAAVFLRKTKEIDSRSYFIALAGFLLAWFFFSPDFGTWGRQLFLYLSIHVPFFTMFRNMYDKFALPLSLTYALVFAISLCIVSQKLKHNWFVVVCIGLALLIGSNFVNAGISLKNNVSNLSESSGKFTNDFTDLQMYLKNLHDPSHVVWIPMNGPTYANIEDKYLANHYYSGLSPLRVLADMSDYTGRFSFITQSDLFSGDKIFALLEKKKYDEIGKILQQRNAKYVIVDHQKLPSSLGSFMYGGEKQKLKSEQGADFQKIILGKKIKDFGKRYSLYYINPHYGNDKLYLTNSFATFPQNFNQLSYKKVASYQYTIVINNLKDEKKLVFLDPYSRDWVLFLQSNTNQKSYTQGRDELVYNYANGWSINPEQIKENYSKEFYTTNPDGSISLQMLLYFQPQKYTLFANIISVVTLLGMLGYLLIKKS